MRADVAKDWKTLKEVLKIATSLHMITICVGQPLNMKMNGVLSDFSR